MKTNDIRTIGWLNCADGSINLTPVFVDNQHPTIVNISSDAFDSIRHDQELMKQTAVDVLNKSKHRRASA